MAKFPVFQISCRRSLAIFLFVADIRLPPLMFETVSLREGGGPSIRYSSVRCCLRAGWLWLNLQQVSWDRSFIRLDFLHQSVEKAEKFTRANCRRSKAFLTVTHERQPPAPVLDRIGKKDSAVRFT